MASVTTNLLQELLGLRCCPSYVKKKFVLLSLALQKVIGLVFHSVYSEGSKLLSCYFHTVKNHTAGVAENNLERINERMAALAYFKFWVFA